MSIDFFVGLVEIASYAEQHEQIVDFFKKVLSEKSILEHSERTKRYVKIVDKLLRFRRFRQLFISEL